MDLKRYARHSAEPPETPVLPALLCPSVRVKGGINLVVFRDRMRKAEVARVLGEAELKKYLAWTHAILHAIIIDEDAQEICAEDSR